MKFLFSTLALAILAATGYATTVTISASATGTATSTTSTPGTILVNNAGNRGYAVFNLGAAGIPDAATITSVKLVFSYAISGSGVPTGTIYGYAGDISSLSSSSIYSAAVTANTLYTASWGTATGTITLSSTAIADSFIQNNHSNTISATWVETVSSRVYTITGGSSPQLQVTYTCNNPAAIVGTTSVCTSSSTTLTDSTIGGAWASSNTSLASVTTTGIVTGLSQGAVIISYSRGGCSSIHLMSVKSAPAAIGGVSNICLGNTASLSNTAILGTWSSGNPTVATVDVASGIVSARTVGSAVITYSTGCGSAVTKTENVITSLTTISGAADVCRTANTALTNTTTDGTWSSSNSAIASITASGTVYGISQGTATITYGIGSCVTTTAMLVKSAPGPIVGPDSICNGTSYILTNASASGTWSTGNAAIASINAAGLAISVAAGSTVISYSTGCGTDATKFITVQLLPTALVGPVANCIGTPAAFTESVTGGSWSSSDMSVATIDGAGNVTGLSAGSVFIVYTLINACGTNSVNRPLTVAQPGYWLGGTNTNWNDAANWACNAVPDASIDAFIPSGTAYLPNLAAAGFDVHNLTIAPGVTLTIGGSASVNVHGNLTNNGSANGNGTVIMAGASLQTIYGKGSIANLTVNNAAGVTINAGDSVKITNELNLADGTFSTNSGLRLASDSAGTARIAQITGGAITGNVNIEQYFAGGRRAYRFFGHPFSTSIPLSMIGANLDVTGNGGAANGFTTTASNAPSCFRYNPFVGNSAMPSDPGWKPFTNANATTDTNEFKQYQGIRLFVRGAKTQGLGYAPYTPLPVTVSMTGLVNTGTQVVTLHKGANSDYNQVSNPYPSPTDIGNVIANAQAAGQVTGAAFFVWNPFLGAAGAFEPKFIGMHYVINQNSSFQVRAVNNGSTLTFTESDKAATINETLLRATPSQYISLNILDNNNHLWDMMYLSFNNDATNNEDSRYDATKAMNPDLNFYSFSGSTKFSVDARPFTEGTTIPLGLTTNYAQKYTIKAANMALPAGVTLYLHDKLMGKYVELSMGTEYSFEITNDRATQGENRFELTTNDASQPLATEALHVSMSPNPATDNVAITYTNGVKAATTITVVNATGAVVITKTIGNNASGKATISLNEIPAGVYMVEVTCGNNKQVQKLVKE